MHATREICAVRSLQYTLGVFVGGRGLGVGRRRCHIYAQIRPAARAGKVTRLEMTSSREGGDGWAMLRMSCPLLAKEGLTCNLEVGISLLRYILDTQDPKAAFSSNQKYKVYLTLPHLLAGLGGSASWKLATLFLLGRGPRLSWIGYTLGLSTPKSST